MNNIFIWKYHYKQNGKPFGSPLCLIGAGNGNRTRISCLGSKCFTTKLYLHILTLISYHIFIKKASKIGKLARSFQNKAKMHTDLLDKMDKLN